MHYFLGIAHAGLVAVLLHPLRSVVTVGCLVAVLLPYLAGLGLSRGIEREADLSIRQGADLYVTGSQFGRTVPVPLELAEDVRKLQGVTEVVPRIVGPITLGKNQEPAVLVGVPLGKFPPSVACVEGRLYGPGAANQLVVGTELARRLHLQVGSFIPPFYQSAAGDRVSEVVGLFRSDVSLWESRLALTSFETAAAIFDQPGLATELLVWCQPGYQEAVTTAILRLRVEAPPGAKGRLRLRVTGKEDLQAIVPRGLLHREGVFNLLFLLAFVVAISVILVTSGVGLAERRREIGILKATGWQTDEILLRSLVESGCLSLAGAALSVVLAFAWLRWLNGYWIAGVFLAGVDVAPGCRVPFQLTPVPALLAFVMAFMVVGSGSLVATWRAATVPPVRAMR